MNNPLIWVPRYKISSVFSTPVIDNPNNYNLFTLIQQQLGDTEITFDSESTYYNYIYYHSGYKYCSPYVNRMLLDYGFESFSDISTITMQEQVAIHLVNLYKTVWAKRYNTYIQEYSPLDAYDVKVSGNRQEGGTSALQHGLSVSGTDATTYGRQTALSSTVNYGQLVSGSSTAKLSQFGFNTTDENPVPASLTETQSSEHHSGSDTTSSSTTNSGTDSTVMSRNNSGTDRTTAENSADYSETRKGRLGYHTPQDLIRKERDLWLQPFLESMFNDIDKVLALSVY